MVSTATAVLLLLLTVAAAAHNPSPSLVTLPDSDPKPEAAILLPSERPESELVDPAEILSADSKAQETEQYEVKSESEIETDSLPLTTVVTLRPINRHFSRGSFFPFRRGHKCHGYHRRQHNPEFHRLRQRFGGQGFNGQRDISFGDDMIVHPKDQDQDRRQHFHNLRKRFGGQGFNGQREISYGNDMIVQAKDQDQGFDRSFSSEGKGLERWAKYNRGGQRLSFTNKEMEDTNGMVHPHFYRHHHGHRHYPHHRNGDTEEEEHRHENGIIKGIMRFLNL
ncbi:hypothetical protein M5689_008303 [Euphorbia peplus]|nr:hypothetical protein M5689_008303 [Euphorbia peplus]